MRRSIAALAAFVLVLTACSNTDSDPAVTTAPTSEASDNATNDGEGGDQPTADVPEKVDPVISDEGMPKVVEDGDLVTLDFDGATDPGQLQVAVVTKGDGREVTAEDMVVANYVGQVWGNPDPFESSYERGAPTAFPLSGVVQGWRDGLSGQTVGSRVIISIPSELGYGLQGGNPGAGIGPDDTIAFVVDIIDAFAADSYGQPDAKVVNDSDLPVEIDGKLGEPFTLKVKDGAPEPEVTTTTVLAEGTGDKVGPYGTTVYLQFRLTTWDNETTETSEDFGGLQSVQLAEITPFAGLVDIPVGSRVLIEIPATETAPAMAAVADIVGQIPPAGDTGGE